MTPVELIQKKRDGGALSNGEIAELVTRFMAREITDYQMSAMLMAMFLRGMEERETIALMQAMLHSGRELDLSSVKGPKVDKHSTGGVGDKVSICLAPLVAACGVFVPMVSGRGLGHTGGTLDKLQSIPGFRIDLDEDAFERIVRETGACLIGPTAAIAPADKRMYALRDVTGTIESIPLIVASILSKKLAEGIDGLVLDVKVGHGAFMKDVKSARKLAEALVRVGSHAGKKVTALLTSMNAPLGRTVGNALEIREAMEVLRGEGPDDLVECTLALGREMLLVARVAKSARDAEDKLKTAIRDGSAVRTMERIVAAQGGDARVVTDSSILPAAPVQAEVLAARPGFVTHVDALEIGLSAVAMGAGRMRAEDPVDPGVGIEILAKPGDAVRRGEPLARVHLRERAPAIEARVRAAFSIGPRRPTKKPLILERITMRSR